VLFYVINNFCGNVLNVSFLTFLLYTVACLLLILQTNMEIRKSHHILCANVLLRVTVFIQNFSLLALPSSIIFVQGDSFLLNDHSAASLTCETL
jgi:hypothetical protein